VNTSVLLIGNSTANVFVNSTAFVGNVVATTVSGNLSGTAANATLLNNKTEGNLNVNSALYANASITNTFTVGTGTYFVSNGNVGVGNTTPGHKLAVQRASGLSTPGEAYFTDGTYWTMLNTRQNPGTFNPLVQSGDHTLIYSDGTSGTGAFVLGQWSTNPNGIRIDASGNMGIGNATPAHKLRVTGTTSLAGAVSDITTLAAGNTTITGFINSTSTGQFGGEVTAVDFNSTSDIRFKSDIVKIEGALDKVNELSGYTFTMNETGERSTGLIAQEVEKVLPEAVKGEDKKTLSYGNMIGLLVEAIKEQGRKIEVLESELNKLKER
jgi:hypothetical protein